MAPHALACPACHTLVHSEELAVLSARATRFEGEGAPDRALDEWRKALPLLPTEARQAGWVRDRIGKLELARAAAPRQQGAWAKRLGPLAPIVLFLAKAKWLLAVLKLNFLLSLGAFLAVYWAMWGWKFGVGFGAQVLIHELGHYVEIRRRGLPADMPVFFPGLGAYVRWRAMGVSLETRAAVSLAGPFAGFLAALVCLLVWWKTGDPLWAALTRAGAWINVANLVPVWILDGGQAANALDRRGRSAVLLAGVAFAALFWEGAFLLVAAGASWRLFRKDLPALPSVRTAAYFIGVLGLLGLVLRLVPGRGFGQL
jgi:Zn-dependent protease